LIRRCEAVPIRLSSADPGLATAWLRLAAAGRRGSAVEEGELLVLLGDAPGRNNATSTKMERCDQRAAIVAGLQSTVTYGTAARASIASVDVHRRRGQGRCDSPSEAVMHRKSSEPLT
jgi:hypothetical protein